MEDAPVRTGKEEEGKGERRALYALLEKELKTPSTKRWEHIRDELLLALLEQDIGGEGLWDLAVKRSALAEDWNRAVEEMAVSRERATAAIESVIDKATEVMGDRQEAMRWLGTPARALNFATPISLLATSDGLGQVMDVLGQMEHGVW